MATQQTYTQSLQLELSEPHMAPAEGSKPKDQDSIHRGNCSRQGVLLIMHLLGLSCQTLMSDAADPS